MIIVSLLLLSSKSDYAYPKGWQRQVLLNMSIMSGVTVRRLLTKYIFSDKKKNFPHCIACRFLIAFI